MGGTIISGVILGLCAILMVGIGIFQVNSTKPVGFYTGVKAPDENELSDMNAWNKKHGIMWILYGVCIEATWVCGLFIGDEVISWIIILIGLFLPMLFMILYHKKLIKDYVIKK